MSDKTFYELIGVDKGASPEELQAAWRTVSRRLHPDRHVTKSAEEQFATTQAFAAASQAYAVLSNTKSRRDYDKTLKLQGALCGTCKGEGRTFKQQGPLKRIATACAACCGNGYIKRKTP